MGISFPVAPCAPLLKRKRSMYLGQQVWSETTAGTNSGAVATHSAITDRQHFVTSISGHTDTDSIITIKDGTTIVWETKIDVSVEGTSFSFTTPCIPITPGANAVGTIASSSSDSQVNLTGYTI
jgi:hypothetical protein